MRSQCLFRATKMSMKFWKKDLVLKIWLGAFQSWSATMVPFAVFIALAQIPFSTANSKEELQLDDQGFSSPGYLRAYDVKVLKKSRSGKYYSFQIEQEFEFKTGKVLLLQKENEDTMSIRVIRTNRDEQEFIAKKVRKYRDHEQLTETETYTALEWTGLQSSLDDESSAADRGKYIAQSEFNPRTIQKAESETQELDELDKAEENKKSDPELDSKSQAQPPEENLEEDPDPPNEENDNETSNRAIESNDLPGPSDDDIALQDRLSVDELKLLDKHNHWISAHVGLIRNDNKYFSSGGMRYAITFASLIFQRSNAVQDSFALEAGAYSYKIIGLEVEGDGYNVIPLLGLIRYNIFFDESLAFFLYAGAGKSLVSIIPESESTLETKQRLERVFPAAGVGVIFHLGPSWDFRLDLGWDSRQLGLMLRF